MTPAWRWGYFVGSIFITLMLKLDKDMMIFGEIK
jgi:hypothetical protein